MNKNLKIDKLLKWIFKTKSFGFKDSYRSLSNDTNSTNSLPVFADDTNNIKAIESQSFRDKKLNKRRIQKRNKKTNSKKSKIEYCKSDYLDRPMNENIIGLKMCFPKKNHVEYMNSRVEYQNYLNKIWTPKLKKLTNDPLNSDLLDFPNDLNSICSSTQQKFDILNLLLDTTECSICESDLNDYESIEIMPCSCIFHLYCISSHLVLKKICPYCFQIFTKKEITSYTQKWRDRYWLA